MSVYKKYLKLLLVPFLIFGFTVNVYSNSDNVEVNIQSDTYKCTEDNITKYLEVKYKCQYETYKKEDAGTLTVDSPKPKVPSVSAHFFDLRLDYESADDRVEGQSSESNSGADSQVLIQGIYHKLDGLSIWPSLEINNSNKAVLDREDEYRGSIRIVNSPERELFNPIAPDFGLHWGGGLWYEDREFNSKEDDRYAFELFGIWSINYNPFGLEDDLKVDFGAELISANQEFYDGEHYYLSIANVSPISLEGGFSYSIPRVVISYFNADSSNLDNQRVVSVQGRVSYDFLHKSDTNYSLELEFMTGYDSIDNYLGGDDLSSSYIRPGITFSYNPFKNTNGGGSGQNSGGGWRRP